MELDIIYKRIWSKYTAIYVLCVYACIYVYPRTVCICMYMYVYFKSNYRNTAAATDPEPAPPTTGACCRRIWGRGYKNTVAYPVAEQDMQKRVRLSSMPRRA